MSTPNQGKHDSGNTQNPRHEKKQNSNFRGKRPNYKNRNRAEQDINPDAAPKDLSGLINSITQLDRGNVKVTLDDEFVERAGQDYLEIIASVQRNRNHLEDNGNPLEHGYLVAGTMVGLSLATARKLIIATPESQRATISEFFQVPQYDIKIPSTFVQLSDMLGKVSQGDWNIRMKYNSMMIKRFLTKGLLYASSNADFLATYIPNDDGQHDGLAALRETRISSVVFEDQASAEYIKDSIKKKLTQLLTRYLVYDNQVDGDGHVRFSYAVPQLNVDTATRVEILEWLGNLNADFHSDPNDDNFFQNLVCCGLSLLVNHFWLSDMTTRLRDLDAAFRNINVLGDLTVRQLLNAGGYNHIQQFVARAQFKTYFESLFTYYSLTITPRLHIFYKMVNQGLGSLGSPAQMIYLGEEAFTWKEYPPNVVGLNRREIKSGYREAYSYLKMDLIDPVVKCAMYGITADVEVSADYWITYSRALTNIRANFASKDNIIMSNIKLFNM
jgi:hypothetical protein